MEYKGRKLWALLIPLMVEQMLNTLMGMADTMMVSNCGSAAISSVSLVDSINLLILFIFTAMATGGTIICSQYIGSGSETDATDVGEQLIFSVCAISTAITVFCIAFRLPLLQLIFGQVEQSVMDGAIIYFMITALSYPFIALYNAGAALFRACGNSKLPMKIAICSNVLNVIGNAIFIFGMNLSVIGAALATLISRIVMAVCILSFLKTPGRPVVVKSYLRIRPKPERIKRILAIGIPTGVENGMFQFGKLVIQSTVSTMGTVAIAANSMTAMMEQVTSNLPLGIGLGMMTVVGQLIGAKKLDEAKKTVIQLTGYGEIAMIGSCIVIAILAKPITVIGGMVPEAAELTLKMVYFFCIVKPFFWFVGYLLPHGLRAAGDVKYSMMVSAGSMWGCRVLVTLCLARIFHLGPISVWIGMASDWAMRGIFYIHRFRSNKWLYKSAIR